LGSTRVRQIGVTSDRASDVVDQLAKFPKSKNLYYELREQGWGFGDELYQAARFIYLNRFSFNGIYRTNMSGAFNVPYAPKSTGDLPDIKELTACAKLLKGAKIQCCDFITSLDRAVKGDFAYIDPPYAIENRRIFRQYGPQTFGLEDVDRLSEMLVKLDDRGISFLVSYAYCTESIKLARNWYSKKMFTTRNVAGFAHHRRKAAELLVSNNPL
jgi:DNA adenine methylase